MSSGNADAARGWTRAPGIVYAGGMEVRATSLPEVKILTPRRFGDQRGYFSETWSAARMAEEGLTLSDKDRRAPMFHEWISPFEYGVNA